MLTKLSGPSRPPAAGGAPQQLVILLHGLGADGNDLIGLAPFWAPQLPEAEFLAPNAPFACDMAPYGYQWFSVQDRSPAAVLGGVRAAAPILDGFIDEALAERGLDDSRLALVGCWRRNCWRASCAPARRCCSCTAPMTRLFPTLRWRRRKAPCAPPGCRWRR